MLCLGGFELYSRLVPLVPQSVKTRTCKLWRVNLAYMFYHWYYLRFYFLSLLLPIIWTWRCPTRELLLLWTLYTNDLIVYCNLKYDTLGFRREIHALNLAKKCVNQKHCPQFLMDYFYFNSDIVQRKTRQSNHLRLPSIKLECTKKAFYYHGCEVFNRNLKFLLILCSNLYPFLRIFFY